MLPLDMGFVKLPSMGIVPVLTLGVFLLAGPFQRNQASQVVEDRTAEDFLKLITEHPNDIELVLEFAKYLQENDRDQEAVGLYQRALNLEPRSRRALLGLGESLLRLKRAGEALQYYMHALSIDRTDLEARRSFAVALFEAGTFYEAEMMLKDLLKGDPNDGQSTYYLARLYYRDSYFELALDLLEKAIKLGSHVKMAKIYRASSLVQVGRFAEAEKEFEVLQSEPEAKENIDFLLGWAQLLYEDGRLDQALRQADRACGLHAESAMAHFWRARILKRLGRLEEAEQEAETAVRLSPRLSYPHSLLLQVYRLQGKTAEAAREAA